MKLAWTINAVLQFGALVNAFSRGHYGWATLHAIGLIGSLLLAIEVAQ